MKYATHHDFMPSVYNLYKKNGLYKNVAQRVLGEWAKTQNEAKHVFRDNDVCNIPLTHRGENRIQHCRKYNLSNNCRLITVFDQDTLIFLFLGTHEEGDEWLDKNRGGEFFSTLKTAASETTISHIPVAIPTHTIKIAPEITTQVTQLRDEINTLKHEIEAWSTLIDYQHGTSETTNNGALETDRTFFLKEDTPFFFKRIEKIADNLKKHNTIVAQSEIDKTAFFMEIFFLKMQHIDKLKQLISLTKH